MAKDIPGFNRVLMGMSSVPISDMVCPAADNPAFSVDAPSAFASPYS
ncbi:hypothetical protein [Candidatus Brocadia sinica]|nr:hypothetical protein [Candidatus Brocadia sinica]